MKTEKIIAVLAAGFILLFLGITSYIRSTYSDFVVSPIVPVTPGVTPQPSPTPDPDRPFSVLLLGYGGAAHEGGYLTDTIIVLKIFPKEKRAVTISVPRDLYINLPVKTAEFLPYKINHAYAIGIDDEDYPEKPLQYTGPGGGGAMAKFAVSAVIGEPIDYFVAASFQGFKESIDVLGGIDVYVDRPFTDEFYPDPAKATENCGRSEEEIAALTATMSGFELEKMFPCRYERLEFTAGQNHFNGETALKYVRSRHSATEGSDFSRSRRQNQVIAAVKSKIITVNFIPKIVPFISSLKNDVVTDIPLAEAASFLSYLREASSYQLKAIFLSPDNTLTETNSPDGQYILTPKSGMFNWEETAGYIYRMTTLSGEATGSGNTN